MSRMEAPSLTIPKEIRLSVAIRNPEFQEALRAALEADEGIKVVASFLDGSECSQAMRSIEADVLLIETSIPTCSGFVVAERLSLERPEIATILVGDTDDLESLRAAIGSGAMDFLSSSSSKEEISVSISRAYEMASGRLQSGIFLRECRVSEIAPRQTGKLITVCGGKGGAGKSTIAAFLARYFVERSDLSVALADFDLQFGDIGVLFDIESDKSILDLLPVVDELDSEVLKSAACSSKNGLDLFLAPLQLRKLDVLRPTDTANLLAALRGAYRNVVVNTASQVSETHLDLFERSDLTLVVVNQDIPSLKACAQLRSVYEGLGLDLDRLCVIVNKFSPEHHITLKRIEEHLGLTVAGSIGLYAEDIVSAFIRGGFERLGAPARRLSAVDALGLSVGEKLGIVDELKVERSEKRMDWRRLFMR